MISELMNWSPSFRSNGRKRVLVSCAFLYLLMGGVLTLTTGGCFCSTISRQNQEMEALYQEFLQARPAPSTLADWLHKPLGEATVAATVLAGTLSFTTNGQPGELWIAPFSGEDDAVCIQFGTETHARIQYFKQRPPRMTGQPTRLLFINECWPRLRLARELQIAEAAGIYSFFISPAEPLEHNKTITIYGFGSRTNYAAKVMNPGDFPHLHRRAAERYLNSLNYLWAFPADMLVTPIADVFTLMLFWMASGKG